MKIELLLSLFSVPLILVSMINYENYKSKKNRNPPKN